MGRSDTWFQPGYSHRWEGRLIIEAKTTALLIFGTARGGAIVDRILGQMPGFQYVGEARNTWSRNFLEHRNCGCHTPFMECEFVKVVGDGAFGGFDRLDVDAVTKLRAYSGSKAALLQVMSPWKTSAYVEKFQQFARALGSLYRAVQKASTHCFGVESLKRSNENFVHARYKDLMDRPSKAFAAILDLVRGDSNTGQFPPAAR